MLPDGAINAEHLWKRFRADRHRAVLRDRLSFSSLRNRSDAERWRWVLSDINLRIEPGEAIGLIGSNGSGKSTLLKILTGVMFPHSGRLEVRGRIGALLEVRAGLHGDLTGRENVQLYGTLLGLDRATIASRFDDIVDFAGLESAIDRQVKFYSSGMQMRLGFSVAAYLEPDILLVDEALAVGDAFFQQRCLERMRDLLRQGTTLVLVSHDLTAIEGVCTRGMWLDQGVVAGDGPLAEVLTGYRRWYEDAYQAWADETTAAARDEGRISVKSYAVHGEGDAAPHSYGPATVHAVLDIPESTDARVCIGVSEGTATPVFLTTQSCRLEQGAVSIQASLPYLPLAAGRYYAWIEVDVPAQRRSLPWQPMGAFTVDGPELETTPVGVRRASPVQVDAELVVESRPPLPPEGP
jgi:ABC-type polysaccharide/polyol phosphate transport system ATPase subunit